MEHREAGMPCVMRKVLTAGHIWRLLLLVGLAAVLLMPRAADADVVIIDATEELALELHRGQIVRLPRPADSIFVADPDIADVQIKSARLFYVLGRGVGKTTLFVMDANDNVMVSRRVKVTHNLETLRATVAELVPGAEVRVESIDRNLVISGTVPSAVVAENLRRVAVRFAEDEASFINRLQVEGPRQINLRVRIAEMSRDLDRRLGIRWENLLHDGSRFVFGFVGGGGAGLAGSFGAAAGIATSRVDLNFMIDALSEEGLMTILAEPNLTALSGETASFLAGGEFPIPVAQRGDGTITLEFKEFGVGLTFTPTLLDGDRISLRVNPEVSELNPGAGITLNDINVPGINTRRAATTVELGSGQSFAIAGLLNNTTRQEFRKLPGLGDLPVLGALFRSTEFRSGETELVIIVTPYVVEPAPTARVLATPIDGYVPPNDVERILLGRFVGADAPGRTTSAGRPRPIGFLLE